MHFTKNEMIILKRSFLFRQTTINTFLKIAEDDYKGLLRMSYKAGTHITLPEEPSLGFVLDGMLTEIRSPHYPDRDLTAGSVIGASDLFIEKTDFPQRLKAAEDSKVLYVPRSQILRMFEEEPSLMVGYMEFLASDIRDLKWEHVITSTRTTSERVKCFLKMYMTADEETGETSVALPCSGSALADRLHMSRASLYRIFDQLTEDGVIKKENRTIRILKPEELEAE